MRRPFALLVLTCAACEAPALDPVQLATVRQPVEATSQVLGGGLNFKLGTSLAVCPSRSLLVGAPGALPAALLWTTVPGQPQLNGGLPLPLSPSLAPGVSVSCGADFQVGAPGPEAMPAAPSAVYFRVTGVYDGGLGTRLGASMATLPPGADGGAERYVVGAPGVANGLGAVQLWSTAPNPSITPLVPLAVPSALGTSVVVGDFNGDGRFDIAAGASAQVLIFLQQSSTNFAQSPLNLVPGGLSGKASLGTALAVSPARAGERQLLAVGVPEVNSVYLVALSLDGGVDFSPTLGGPGFGGSFGSAVALGDWDQDGVVELFASAPGDADGRVTRWVLDGGWRRLSGDFVPPTGSNPGGSYGRAIAVGDIAGNPGPELIVGAPNFQSAVQGAGAYFVYAFDGGSGAADAGLPNFCFDSSGCPQWCGAPQDCIGGTCVPRAPACLPDEVCVADGAMPGVCAPLDAGIRDAGERDAGPPDAGPRDAGERDAGGRDAGATDAGGPDAGSDAATADAGAAAGGRREVNYQACGCSSAGPLPGVLAVLLHLIWRRRRLAA